MQHLKKIIGVFILINCSLGMSFTRENPNWYYTALDSNVINIGDNKSLDSTTQRILFLGNSLTAGYGIDPSKAFPALIQKKIDSLGLAYKAINAGLSGETSAGGLRRIPWLLKRKVDILILELGANDGLRGVAVKETQKNLQAIIEVTQRKYPDVKIVIAGMQVPPNIGKAYTARFKSIFIELAKFNHATLIPFLLGGVGGKPELNLPDGIHPTAAGHRIIAENVWEIIKPILEVKE